MTELQPWNSSSFLNGFTDSHDTCESNNFIVYKIRWFMLFLLVMCSICLAMQFPQFTIIANVIVDYYSVSYEAVNWSGILFLLISLPCIFPAMHIMEKIEIRTSLLLTMFGTCVAAWIKVGSVAPERYWLILFGQAVGAVSQVFVTVLPARFAATWFGKDQTALACGIGVTGIQIGTAVGCIVPTILVKFPQDRSGITYDLYTLNIAFGVMSSVFLLLSFAFFKSQPLTAPSGAQEQLETIDKIVFLESTKRLFKNSSYLLLLVAYGINVGICNALATLLNQIVLQYYPDSLEDAGIIGLLIIITGLFGVTVCGYLLDKFKQYRITTTVLSALCLFSMIAFTTAFYHSITAVYVASTFVGFFMLATYSVGFEVAAEITYPISETTSSGYLFTAGQAFGIAFIYLYSFILYKYGPLWANITTCIELFISAVLVSCMRFKLERQAAEELHTKTVNNR